MNVTLIKPDDATYPIAIDAKLRGRPAIAAIGNLDLLHCRPLALFCSIKCPGDVILQSYDLIRALRDARVPMIGGFHSPMEQECLSLLLRGSQPVIVCPARCIQGMRLPRPWKQAIEDRRLLVLSPFAKTHCRPTADISQERNRFVSALADQILVAHAAPGGKTEAFCGELLTGGRSLWTLPSEENAALITAGARVMVPEAVCNFPTSARVDSESEPNAMTDCSI